jgi:hypothetical protein
VLDTTENEAYVESDEMSEAMASARTSDGEDQRIARSRYIDMIKTDLQYFLKSGGLKATGNKKELVARLIGADEII